MFLLVFLQNAIKDMAKCRERLKCTDTICAFNNSTVGAAQVA